jgi:hypothetical protein
LTTRGTVVTRGAVLGVGDRRRRLVRSRGYSRLAAVLGIAALAAQFAGVVLHAWQLEDARPAACRVAAPGAGAAGAEAICRLTPRDAHRLAHHDVACPMCQILQQARHSAAHARLALAAPSVTQPLLAPTAAEPSSVPRQRATAPRAPPLFS